eukprot:gene17944-24347_t
MVYGRISKRSADGSMNPDETVPVVSDPNGITSTSSTETSNANGRARNARPGSSSADAATMSMSQNVITQVTTRQVAPTATSNTFNVEPNAGRRDLMEGSSWSSRMRSLFCCFAPNSNGYFKSVDGVHGGMQPRMAPPQPPEFNRQHVIGPKRQDDLQKKTLVLDLDETLVHSSFKPVPNPDWIIPVEIDGKLVDVYVLKRPFLDHFMDAVGSRFEVVVFTASLAKYADPLLDLLDKNNVVRWRLFREACCPYEGNYVKDLNCLGRDLSHTIIVDNSPHSYVFQPSNAVPIGTFIDEMDDQELLELLATLLQIETVGDVRPVLNQLFSQL